MKNINVLVGDTVMLILRHHRPQAKVIGVIKEITERIGYEDLIEIDPISDERSPRPNVMPLDVFNSFSVSFVKEILNRPERKGRYTQKLPKNHLISETNYTRVIRKGVKSGSLSFLFIEAMKKASIEVIDLNFEKCVTLWLKQKPGFLKRLYGQYYVHWKPFQKWVLRNQTKLIKGRKSIKKEVRARDKEYADQYWKDVDRQLEQDFDMLGDVNMGLAEQLDEDWKLY